MSWRGGIERLLVVDEPDFKLFHGDTFKVMPYLDKQFTMIFCDPPFFTWAGESKGDEKPDHNMLSYEIYKRLDYYGCVYLCGTQPQLAMDWHYWARFYTFLYEKIQAKNAGPPAINRKQPRRVHENIWCLYRSKDKFSDLKITVDRITKKGATKVVEGRPMRIWGKGKKDWRVGVGYPTSVFYGKRVDKNSPEYVGHPTQKPEKLIEELILMSTEEGDWIFDPFAGSGTVSTVARRLGRNSIAVEIEDKWIPIIEKRVQVEKTRTSITDFINEDMSDEEYAEMRESSSLSVEPRKEKLGDFFKQEEEP